MRLSWEVDYQDYADTEHWLPRLEELKTIYQTTSVESACSFDKEHLLNFMEQLDEMIKYYTSISDYQNLEPIMKTQDTLIHFCSRQGFSEIGFLHLQMQFYHTNAILYYQTHRNRQASEYFTRFTKLAKNCLTVLKNSTDLTPDQILYVGWSCVKGLSGSAITFLNLLDTASSLEIFDTIIPIIGYLEPYMENTPGILDEAANLYAEMGANFYPQGRTQEGAKCFQNSMRFYQKLKDQSDSDFYTAKYLWVKSTYGYQEFYANGNPTISLSCESDVNEFLSERSPHKRELGILLGVLGSVFMQRYVMSIRIGQPKDALSAAQSSQSKLETALQLLEEDYRAHEKNSYYYGVIFQIANEVYNRSIFASEALGLSYGAVDNNKQSKYYLEKTMSLIVDSEPYHIAEHVSVLLRAECAQYLSYIAAIENDLNQTEFYGTQSIELATSAAATNPAANRIIIGCAHILAPLYLELRRKTDAKKYAEIGLAACHSFSAAFPEDNSIDAMKSDFEKYYKKASRRFF